LKAEAARWSERSGSGSGASRLISGTSAECLALEERVAAWKGFEAAIVLGSGYAANVGVIQALVGHDDAVFADKLNHASINAGCRLSGAAFRRYKHCDAARFEKMISAGDVPPGRLLVSDSVFSMDGDVAPLAELHAVAKAHDAFVLIDDAHASGVMGERGHGLGSTANCDMVMSTFSKALGSCGACLACSAAMKEHLVNKCGPFIYSTAPPPGLLGAISAAVAIVESDEGAALRAKLSENAKLLREGIKALGFDCGPSETMIVPLIVGDATKCVEVAAKLLDAGFFAPAVRPPTVPKNSARLRISLNAAHGREDVERLLAALAKAV
jgi:glycine C-acetyltransferase